MMGSGYVLLKNSAIASGSIRLACVDLSFMADNAKQVSQNKFCGLVNKFTSFPVGGLPLVSLDE